MPKYSGNQLFLENGTRVSFEFDIKKIISFENFIAVLLEIPPGTIFNENVFGVSLNGEIIWQIEKLFPDTEDSPHTNIKSSVNGLEAYNWSGVKVGVHLRTGKTTYRRITK